MRILNNTQWSSQDIRKITRVVAGIGRLKPVQIQPLIVVVAHRGATEPKSTRPYIIVNLPTFPTLVKDRMTEGTLWRGIVGLRFSAAFARASARGLPYHHDSLDNERAVWERRLKGFQLRWLPKAPKGRAPKDVRAEAGLKHARTMMRTWQSRKKLVETKLKKWSKKAKYYERVLLESRLERSVEGAEEESSELFLVGDTHFNDRRSA